MSMSFRPRGTAAAPAPGPRRPDAGFDTFDKIKAAIVAGLADRPMTKGQILFIPLKSRVAARDRDTALQALIAEGRIAAGEAQRVPRMPVAMVYYRLTPRESKAG